MCQKSSVAWTSSHRRHQSHFHAGRGLVVLTFACCALAGPAAAQTITLNSCYLRVLEEANVPALNRGVLQQVIGTEGATVAQGEPLATLDDTEARIAVEVAKLDLLIATKRHESSVTVEIATAALEEAKHLLEQARITSRIARQQAESDTAVRQATKSRDAALADLNRALAARKEFKPSVSDAELERLQLHRDSGELQIEKARDDLRIAGIRTGVEDATIQQQQSAVRRLEFELNQARTESNVTDLMVRMKQESLALAEEQLRRRQVLSPLVGVIVEQMRDTGEWVEPGDTVFRIVRLDRLLVEGHADASQMDLSARGRSVRVSATDANGTVTVSGKITFVSPEIDPVNQQVQVKAEIDNSRLQLRPGQPVVMEILPHDQTRRATANP
ncbi:MAG: HlyD family efflux transporter periplasmic adaptor subunit [Planctomycetaceae bacterium]